MLGTLDRTHREVTVVGAGVAGLLAAYRLDQLGYEVTLLEEKPRAGGLIATTQTPYGPAEAAAHSFLVSAPVGALCAELGVELTPVRRDSKARYVWRGGRARKLPLSARELAETLWRATTSRAGEESPTMAEWARRHLGPAALDYLIAPFLTGIYAAAPEEVSVAAAFPRLALAPGETLVSKLFRRSKDRRERAPMMAPREGMGALVGALEARVAGRLGARFRKGLSVSTLPDAPNLVLSLPAAGAAALLRADEPELAAALEAVPYSPLVTSTVFVETSKLARVPRGVGLLVAPREDRRLLGVLFNSSAFEGRAREGFASFTVMLGGSRGREALELGDSELRSVITEELSELVGLKGEPAHFEARRWPRAIPRYGRELEHAWQLARQTWCSRPGRVAFANYTGQVSLRGLIESVALWSDRP